MADYGEKEGLTYSYTADEAIAKYMVVVFGDEDYHVKSPSSQKANQIAGIAMNATTASGDTVRVALEGIVKVIASEAIGKGLEVAINDIEGRVYDPSVWASGDGVVGVLLSAAATSGDQVDCWLRIRTELG